MTDTPDSLAAEGLAPYLTRAASANLEEIGSTGLIRYGQNVDDEFHRQLRGPRAMKVYREMGDNDSSVGASIGTIDAQVRQVKWFPEAADHPQGEAAAAFLSECLDDMSHTWQDFLSECVVSQLVFGFAPFEKCWKYRNGKQPAGGDAPSSRFSDGKLGIRKLAIRAQETLDGWEMDANGGIRGMYQRAAPTFDRVFIPIEKLVLFRPRTSKGNPEGRPILRNAVRSWWFLKRLEELEAIDIERNKVGLGKMELPHDYFAKNASADKKAAILQYAKMLAQIRRNENDGIVVPSEETPDGKKTGFRFSLVAAPGQSNTDIAAAITRHRQSIGQVMLTQFIFLGMDRVGTEALSAELVELFSISLSVLLDSVEETLFRFVISELMELNGFPPEAWPRLKHGDVEKKDVRPMAEALLKLVDGGLLTPDTKLEEYIRNEMRLPEIEANDFDEGGDPNLHGDGGAAADVDSATMISRLADAIEKLVGIDDLDMANACRMALAKLIGVEAPPDLEEKPEPEPPPTPLPPPAPGAPPPTAPPGRPQNRQPAPAPAAE